MMFSTLRIVLTVVFVLVVGYGIVWKNQEKYVPMLSPREWIRQARRKDRRETTKILLVSLVAVAALLFLLPEIVQLAESSTGTPVSDPDNEVRSIAEIHILLLLVTSIIWAIPEEWWFRGVLYEHLKENWHRWGAFFVQAFLFAGLHVLREGFNYPAFFAPFAAGLVFALVYDYAGFGAAVLTHAGNNGIRLMVAIAIVYS